MAWLGAQFSANFESEEVDIIFKSHAELDLTNQADVRDFFHEERPDVVILAAAKVGGIHANNSFPAEFIYENLMIECNVIHQSFAAGVSKTFAARFLLYISQSCAPADAWTQS